MRDFARARVGAGTSLDVLAPRRYPFAELPPRVVGFEGARDLLATTAGDRGGVPLVHGVAP